MAWLGGRAAAAAAMEVVVTVVVAGSATVVEGTEVVATVTVVALPAATERCPGVPMKVGAEEQMVAKAEAMGQHTSHRSQLHQEMVAWAAIRIYGAAQLDTFNRHPKEVADVAAQTEAIVISLRQGGGIIGGNGGDGGSFGKVEVVMAAVDPPGLGNGGLGNGHAGKGGGGDGSGVIGDGGAASEAEAQEAVAKEAAAMAADVIGGGGGGKRWRR